MRTNTARSSAFCLVFALAGANAFADLVRVRYPQGSVHAFVELRTQENMRIATGDFIESVHGSRVSCRTTFHFEDGSIDDELTVFSQRQTFRLISDHHVQRGPTFPKPIDVFIDAFKGQITYRTQDGKISREHIDLPNDVANGLSGVLLMNILPSAPETSLSWVAPMAKPKLVRLSVKPAGEVEVHIGGLSRKAIDYVIHVELGVITGAIASLIGKQPADYHILILAGDEPAFLREEGQFYEDGPIWYLQQISAVFPRDSAAGQLSNK